VSPNTASASTCKDGGLEGWMTGAVDGVYVGEGTVGFKEGLEIDGRVVGEGTSGPQMVPKLGSLWQYAIRYATARSTSGS